MECYTFLFIKCLTIAILCNETLRNYGLHGDSENHLNLNYKE